MEDLTTKILALAKKNLGANPHGIKIPPPVFTLMGGEIIAFDSQKVSITVRFPVKEAFQNPYGSMQGGMIVAAIDNTIGPIALLHKNANVTKRLEIDYEKMITKDLEYIYIDAWYVSESERDIYYKAKVHNGDDVIYTLAFAQHRIIKL